MQDVPLPENPVLQVHVYEPFLFVQVELGLQLLEYAG
jgi:hypothetical protein